MGTLKVRIKEQQVGRLIYFCPQVYIKTKKVTTEEAQEALREEGVTKGGFLYALAVIGKQNQMENPWKPFSTNLANGSYVIDSLEGRRQTYEEALQEIKNLSDLLDQDYELAKEEKPPE